jgi:hypothetical protein
LVDEPKERTAGVERVAVRLVVPVLLLASTAGALMVSVHTEKSAIPSLAFGSHVVLAIQVALLFFYGSLLLLVPLARAVFDGDLPIELSLRGARWKEEVDDLGDEITDRLTKAEQRALVADQELKQDIEEHTETLREVSEALDEATNEAVVRIAALERRLEIEGREG